MTWFKVDDTLAFHRKVVQAGNAAMGLWVRAGAWSAQQLTDGHVPTHMVTTLGTSAQAKRLVAAGLWAHADGGFQFHEWSEENRQPTKEAVLLERQLNARRTALHRDRDLTVTVRKRDADRCRYCGVLVVWTDRRSGVGATYDHVDPLGPNTLENVVVACRACNSCKGNRELSTTGMVLLPPGSFGKPPGGGGSYSDPNRNGTSSDLAPYKSPSRPVPTRPSSSTHPAQSSHAEYASARDDRTPAQRALDRVGTAHSPDAHRLITAWTSTLRRRPPAQVVSKLAVEADVLLAEQQWTGDEIRAGLDEWNRKGLSPTLLPSVMHELHSSDDPDRPVHLPTDPGARLTPEQVEEIIGDYAQMPLEPEELTRSDKAAERRAWIRENTAKWEAEREQQAREILRRRASMRTAG